MTTLGTYWRTVRHLRLEQVLGRVRVRFAKRRPDLRPAPPRRSLNGPWTIPARREVSLFPGPSFVFLNECHALDLVGWDDPSVARLWRYNLHYFDDLNAVDAGTRVGAHRALITRWIAENPPALGTGWEPYPTSLRIVNWVKWFVGGATCETRSRECLATQARWLRQHLERHLLGNHLFANAKALVFAGLFFEGAEAREWLDCGLDIIKRELPEQVLPDGGHFERSPMYHALALEDLLDLVNLANTVTATNSAVVGAIPHWRKVAGKMLTWLRCMTHSDGSLGLFNDAADGIAPSTEELEHYASRLEVAGGFPPAEGVSRLEPSGYVRVKRGLALALLDMAPIGPDYLPGHAHADTLSFELSLGKRRIVVNGGTSCYGLGPQRSKERGTAWHSTVQVSRCDSSEVWSGFRVGRRARPTRTAHSGWIVESGHDGYRFLPGAPEHRRRWEFTEHGLVVEDTVTPAPADSVARFHLAPGLRLQKWSESGWLVLDDLAEVARVEVEIGSAVAADSEHAPRFGVLLPTQSLVVSLRQGRAATRWDWKHDAHPLSQ